PPPSPPHPVPLSLHDALPISIRSLGSKSGSGIPATVEYRGSGTMSSPCPPSTNECTFSTLTLHSIATKVLMRAESSTPAMPMTRSEEHTSELQSRGHLVCRLL